MARISKEAKTGAEKIVLHYLEEHASDALVEKMNADDRTMKDCLAYCCGKARQQAEGNAAVIEDGVVYGWATHFFEETAEAIASEGVETPQAQVKAGPVKTIRDDVKKPAPKKAEPETLQLALEW